MSTCQDPVSLKRPNPYLDENTRIDKTDKKQKLNEQNPNDSYRSISLLSREILSQSEQTSIKPIDSENVKNQSPHQHRPLPPKVTDTFNQLTFGKLQMEFGEYFGNIRHGKPEGQGEVRTKMLEGKYYIHRGNFIDGSPEGFGIVTRIERELINENVPNIFQMNIEICYEGHFQNGRHHGQGKFIFPNGNRYEGNFLNGVYHGKGKLTIKEGSVYEGEFQNGIPHGKGKATYSDGKVYEGDFNKGQYHGKGKSSRVNGDSYEGDFQLGYPEGKGKITKHDGAKYTGDFKKGLIHGQGKIKIQKRLIYEGAFENGQKHGQGTLYTANGRYEGTFVNDKKHGFGVMSYHNGNRYTGNFTNDKKHDYGDMLYSDKTRYKGNFYNNKEYGEGTYYDQFGKAFPVNIQEKVVVHSKV